MEIKYDSGSIIIKPARDDDASIMEKIIELFNTLINSKTLKVLVFDMSCSEYIDRDLLYKIYASCYRCANSDKNIYFINLDEIQKKYLSHFIAPENVIIAPANVVKVSNLIE